MRKISGFFLFPFCMVLLGLSVFVPLENIFVGLFRNLDVKEAEIQIHTGQYNILADGIKIFENIRKGTFQLVLRDNKIRVFVNKELKGDYQILHFVSVPESELKITLQNPARKSRIYQHNLMISPDTTRQGMLMVNEVDMDSYIAGVTEAEAGRRSHPEFYKAQSILARTFALSQMNKHVLEGFHVCDQVHCQVYFGKPKDYSIFTAIAQTRGLILVDENLRPVVATFHSNSGGQTANSEDVWGKYIPYLRSVTDSFSRNMPNYRWQRKISASDWMSYLKIKFDVDTSDSASFHQATHFSQPDRSCCMVIKNKKISLKILREDWKFKSTFFSIIPVGKDSLLFEGRGFGHGVGLCQEGAMKMAKEGYTFDKILNFYFTGIRIHPMESLVFYKEE